ncbi:TIGR03943 family protein [Cryobacterium adonitolivorans]|uniref:TIGR03943 family protein n=1 Tax=Cryobacterium adonitolivorans TaxID=1259189 RepID=A0A4R8W009_9MICO|nr:TIGR03943 family protein [Cryobacterium adonitolivorans]TFB97783.1 TIGR03943 family protein [Cryobacterium adonitolivorans]
MSPRAVSRGTTPRKTPRTDGLSRYLAERWRGIGLSLVVVVATLWLGATGQLGLYIHPRYFIFTTVMAGLGLVFVVASFAFRTRPADESRPAGRPTGDRTTAGRRALALGGSAALLTFAAVAVLGLPPATLTSATAIQREVNSGGLDSEAAAEEAADLVGTGDYDRLSVKEWVSLLAQSEDPALYADKTASITGFVLPDAADPDNVFYVARFVVTCCAVDAQPIGVAVYQPGWQASYDTDDWVQVSGTFMSNPSSRSADSLAVLPTTIEPVDQPSDPYVY